MHQFQTGRFHPVSRVANSTVTRHGLAHQWQAQRIKRRQHRFKLSQVGAMIFAVALMQEAIAVHRVVIDTDTGAVKAHRIGGQAVHPYPALEQGLVEARLGGLTAQHAQDIGEAILGAIGVAQRGLKQRIEGHGARRHPIAYRDQAMVALGQDVAQPDAHHGADTGALPGAVGCDMSIDQVADTHLLDDAKQEWDAVDLFSVEADRGWRGLPRFGSWGDDKAHDMCGNLLIRLTEYTLFLIVRGRLPILPHRA